MYDSARKTGVESPIPLQFFANIFHHKGSKHINATKYKGSFFTHPVFWYRSAISCCCNLPLKCLYNALHILTLLIWQQCLIQWPKIQTFWLDCYASNSMSNLIMKPTNYQICDSAILWQIAWDVGLLAETEIFIFLPPPLNTRCASTSLNTLLFISNFFCLLCFFSKIPTLHRSDYLHFCYLYFSETNQFLSATSMYFWWWFLVCPDWFKQLLLIKQNQCNDSFQLQPTWNSIFCTCYNIFRQKCTIRCNIFLQFWISFGSSAMTSPLC